MKRCIALFSIVCLFFATGCKNKDDGTIKVGAILPMTGYAAFNGQTCKEGLELALSEIDSMKIDYKLVGRRIREYRERSFVVGHEIEVIEGEKRTPAHALSVDDECRLIVRYANGKTEALSAGEVSICI